MYKVLKENIFLFLLLLSCFDLNAQWVQKSNGLGDIWITSLTVKNSQLFAGSQSGVFISLDSGKTWTASNNGLPSPAYVNALATTSDKIFAGTGNGMYLSSDDGASWTSADILFSHDWFNCVITTGDKIYAGSTSGLTYSMDDAATWNSMNIPLGGVEPVHGLAVKGDTVFVAESTIGSPDDYVSGLYYTYSFPSGNWSDTDRKIPMSQTSAVTYFNGNVFAATSSGIYRSQNKGVDWSMVSSINATSFIVYQQSLFAGTYGGVLRSTDNGNTWIPVSDGLGLNAIMSLSIMDTTIFAGTFQKGVWVTSVPELICKPAPPKITILNADMLGSNVSQGNQWYLDGVAIAGASGQTYAATVSGDYQAKITVNGCQSDFSNHLGFVVTGDISTPSSVIEIFPNPVADQLKLRFQEGTCLKEIKIFQIDGRSMCEIQTFDREVNLNISDYAAGLYLIRLSTGKEVQEARFIKR